MKKKTKIITILNLACVLLLILGTTTVADVAIADEPDPRIWVKLNQNAVEVSEWPEGGMETLELTIWDSNGSLLYTSNDYQVWPHSSGFLLGIDHILQPGQIVTVQDYNEPTPTVKTHTVAYISNLVDVDYVKNVISGKADPFAKIKVAVSENQRTVWADDKGDWSADFDRPENEKVDLLPWTMGEIIVHDGDWDLTSLAWPIFIGAAYEGDSISGENWFVGQEVTMQIDDDPDTGISVDYEDIGWPEVGPWILTNVNFDLWDQYDIQPGNVVTLSQGDLSRSIKVEEINVHFADVIENKVVGECEYKIRASIYYDRRYRSPTRAIYQL